MTEEDFAKLGQHLSRVEADVKKFAQIRGYTTVWLPPYGGVYPRIKLLKLENGYEYFISLIMECPPEESGKKRYTSFFKEIPYYLMASIKGTKKKYEPLELYEYKAFNQIEKNFLADLLQCDFRLESYKNGVEEDTIGMAHNFYETDYSYNNFQELNTTIEEFSKNFNYAYDYDPSDTRIPKIKLFKKIDRVLFNIILRPDVGVGERFEHSDEFGYTLRYSRSFYKADEDNDNVVQCCYRDTIFYEKKPLKEIVKSFYKDLVDCDKSIMSEDLECLKVVLSKGINGVLSTSALLLSCPND